MNLVNPENPVILSNGNHATIRLLKTSTFRRFPMKTFRFLSLLLLARGLYGT